MAGAVPGAGVRSAAPALERSAANAEGAVIFTSNRDGDGDLYAVNMDGTGLTQLTNEPFDEYDPLPSPDGRHILFHGDDGLNVMDVDGSGPRGLHDCSVSPEAWSSDSRHIVCPGGEEGMIILDTVDGSMTQLSTSGSTPSWSPDGTTIAFVDENKLYVMPAAGGARRRLGIRKLADYASPTWSPDSQRVAYVSLEAGSRYSLWTIRADGSGGRRLAQNIAANTPSWSPDGSSIVFQKYLAHYNGAFFVIHSDGTGLHEVSGNRNGEDAQAASWSGDGLVLYQRSRFGHSEDSDIYAVSPSGRGGRALTHPFPTGGTNGAPRWINGLHATGTEELPPMMAAPFRHKISFAQPVLSIATDGSRAVPTLVGENLPRLTVWDGGPAGLGAGRLLAQTCTGRSHSR